MDAFVMTVHFLGSRCMYLARTQNLLTKMPTAFFLYLCGFCEVCNYNSVHNQRVLWMDMASSIMLSEKTSVHNILSPKIVQNVLSPKMAKNVLSPKMAKNVLYPKMSRTFYPKYDRERFILKMVQNVTQFNQGQKQFIFGAQLF